MPIWETASDWDSAASEEGVAHESVAYTDHVDDTLVQQGYSISSPAVAPSNLILYYTHQEDDGSTAQDQSGSANDGTIGGCTLAETGVLSTSSFYYDGTDDYVQFPNLGTFGGSDNYSVTMWFKPNSTGLRNIFSPRGEYDVRWEWDRSGNQNLNYTDWDGSSNENLYGNASLTVDEWHHIGLTYNAGDLRFWVNGSQDASTTVAGDYMSVSESNFFGYINSLGENPLDSWLWDVRVYNTDLSSTQMQALYDVVNTGGSLITSEKVI